MNLQLDWTWFLIALPLAFGLGWLASRFDLRQLRLQNRQAPRAYFKGLNFLLNEQQDQAIDAFIEAVQNDPDTSELHFALGNLFRRRGEYERAVRVHEHLLSRGDLSQSERDRAQHALALDFMKAGLLDRAEEALRQLDGTAYENEARLSRLSIYERSREWQAAHEVARALQAAGGADFRTRMAHYACEMAHSAWQRGDRTQAWAHLTEAQQTAPGAARPRLLAAQWHLELGAAQAAIESLKALAQHSPQAMPLAAKTWVQAAHLSGDVNTSAQALQHHYEQQPSLDVLEALMALRNTQSDSDARTRDLYLQHLQHEPSLIAASRWLAGEAACREHPALQKTLDQATRPLARYRCVACGFEAREHHWQCPGCQSWDSYPPRRVEEL